MQNSGSLYVVATPIGNLSDFSFRGIETLKKVDLILSEDTRQTSKLLNHYNIQKKQISYRDENHKKTIPKVLQMLGEGLTLALVSDSGTPLISDPGFKLVEEVQQEGYTVFTIPGPSAVIAALSISGLPTDKFCFLGFLPRKENQIKKILLDYGSLDCTLILYESPFRVVKLLEHINSLLPNRYVAVAKELTKIHECVYRGQTADVLQNIQDSTIKGEYVVLIAKRGYNL